MHLKGASRRPETWTWACQDDRLHMELGRTQLEGNKNLLSVPKRSQECQQGIYSKVCDVKVNLLRSFGGVRRRTHKLCSQAIPGSVLEVLPAASEDHVILGIKSHKCSSGLSPQYYPRILSLSDGSYSKFSVNLEGQ